MEYGYARVSTREQNEERQIVTFERLGLIRNSIFVDKQSGKDFNRRNYKKLFRKLKAGDTLIIKSIDRLEKNINKGNIQLAYTDIQNITNLIKLRNLKLKIVQK